MSLDLQFNNPFHSGPFNRTDETFKTDSPNPRLPFLLTVPIRVSRGFLGPVK